MFPPPSSAGQLFHPHVMSAGGSVSCFPPPHPSRLPHVSVNSSFMVCIGVLTSAQLEFEAEDHFFREIRSMIAGHRDDPQRQALQWPPECTSTSEYTGYFSFGYSPILSNFVFFWGTRYSFFTGTREWVSHFSSQLLVLVRLARTQSFQFLVLVVYSRVTRLFIIS